MSDSGQIEEQVQALPVLGLRTRGEAAQATIQHSVKADNIVLGKASLKTRQGLKKVTASKIAPPSVVLNGFEGAFLRARTQDFNWSRVSAREASYGVSFRAQLIDVKNAASAVDKEIAGWGDSPPSAAHYGPQEVLDQVLNPSTFTPGSVVCLAATCDPYHAGTDDDDGAGKSTGWGLYLVQDSATLKWYALCVIHSYNTANNDMDVIGIVAPGGEDIDPFEPHTYLLFCDVDSVDGRYEIFFVVDEGPPSSDNEHNFTQGADHEIATYLNIEDHPVYFGGAPDIDHYKATPEFPVSGGSAINNPLLWEFAPSSRPRMTNNSKIHMPAHMAISELAFWNTSYGDAAWGGFWTFFEGAGYDDGTTRLDLTDSDTTNFLELYYKLNEDRGPPDEDYNADSANHDHFLDVMASSPLRVTDDWQSGVDALRFNGVAPMVIPNGDIYRQTFGGKRGTHGHKYSRDAESFFLYWEIDSMTYPDQQVLASFVSPQNTIDGLHDASTRLTYHLRGYGDRAAVHWGLKLITVNDDADGYPNGSGWTGTEDGEIWLVFFANGRAFDADNHEGQEPKHVNTSVIGTDSGQAIKIADSAADALGKKIVVGYSRNATWDESTGAYTGNVVTISAYDISGSAFLGSGTLDLASDAHEIHFDDTGETNNYDAANYEYEQGTGETSLIPTWMVNAIGKGKYYLVVGGWIQPGWSGAEELTDIRYAFNLGKDTYCTFRNEEITFDGMFPAWETDVSYNDKCAGDPEDQEAWMGVPEQSGGLHSYRFTQDQKDDPLATAISTVDRSRVIPVHMRGDILKGPSATLQFGAGTQTFAEFEFGPPGNTTTVTCTNRTAAEFYADQQGNTLNHCSIVLNGTDVEFYGFTASNQDSDGYAYSTCGGSADDWVADLDATGGTVTCSQAVAGYMDQDTSSGDADFHCRHTIIGAVGRTCGFGYLGEPLSEDDVVYLGTEGYVTQDVKNRLMRRAISIWDCQEGDGSRLVDIAGSNTISDAYLFPLTAVPKMNIVNGSLDLVELDFHHQIPWGIYSFTEKSGLKRYKSLFDTETGSSEPIGLLEARKRDGYGSQYIVASSGIWKIQWNTGNTAPSLQYVDMLDGDPPVNAMISSQRWGNDVFFTYGGGRPMLLTGDGRVIRVGDVERPRLWWAPHELAPDRGLGGSADAADFFCHGYVNDARDYLGVTGSIKSGNAGIFEWGDLYVDFPSDSTTEPDSLKVWPECKGNGFSYSESFHASLVTKAQTAPNMSNREWGKSPLYDMPEEEKINCQFHWFVTAINKDNPDEVETARTKYQFWKRTHTDPTDLEKKRIVGFFKQWGGMESSTTTYAKIIHYLQKSPSPDATHIRVYRTPRGGGDFYLEGEYAIPSGYGSDGSLITFEVCNKSDEELQGANASLNNYPPAAGLKYLCVFRGRMFYAGDPAFPWRLYWSPIDSPRAVPPIYYKNLEGPITGVRVELDRLFVTTSDKTYECSAADFDYDEVTEDSTQRLGSPVLTQEVKAKSGGLAPRVMEPIDDVGLVIANERSIARMIGGQLFPLTRHMEGFSSEDRPSANLPTSETYRLIYPHAFNIEKSEEWVGIWDRFNSAYIVFMTRYDNSLGNDMALVWYPHYTPEEVSGEFTSYSFLAANDPTDATEDGIYIKDAIEVRHPDTKEPEIWVLAKNGYVYKLHSGYSDGVDYLCLEGTVYEKMEKICRVASDNTGTTQIRINYRMPHWWQSPLGGYTYQIRGRGADADGLSAATVATYLNGKGITDLFVGSVATFRRHDSIYRRTVTGATTDSGDILITLNAALPVTPTEETQIEFGNIYLERITGKGGLWQHDRVGEVYEFNVRQKAQSHRWTESEYTPAEIYAAYTAKEGSVASGYILDGSGSLNTAFSDWARLRNSNEYDYNVAVHPQNAVTDLTWTSFTKGGNTYWRIHGHFSYYAGWPSKYYSGGKFLQDISISHLYTDFTIYVTDAMKGGGETVTHAIVGPATELLPNITDTSWETDFQEAYRDIRFEHFLKHFLDLGIPVIEMVDMTRDMCNTETGATDETHFHGACLERYFTDPDSEVIHATMPSAQLFAYLTAWDLIQYMLDDVLGNTLSSIQPISVGQSMRGNVSRHFGLLHPDCKIALNTGSQFSDYGWYFQRHRSPADHGLMYTLESFKKFEDRVFGTARGQTLNDFHGLSQYAYHWKENDKNPYSLLQVSDGISPITGAFLEPINNFSEEARPYIGAIRTKTGQTEEIENLLGVGETYDLPDPAGSYKFAGFFPFVRLDIVPARFAGYIEDTLTNQYTFRCSDNAQESYYSDYYSVIQMEHPASTWTNVGVVIFNSTLVVLDTDLIDTTTGQTFDKIVVTDYRLVADHEPSDLNMKVMYDTIKKFETGAPFGGTAKTDWLLGDISFAWDEANSRLAITVAYDGSSISFDQIRIISLLDGTTTTSAIVMFEEPDDWNIQVEAGTYNSDSSTTFYVTMADLGISDIFDAATQKLAIIVEASDSWDGWAESSRPYVLNIEDLSEYKAAYYLDGKFTDKADYTFLYGYEEGDLQTVTVDAAKDQARIADINGRGRTFRWGIRKDAPDAPVEIFDDVEVSFGVNTKRSGRK